VLLASLQSSLSQKRITDSKTKRGRCDKMTGLTSTGYLLLLKRVNAVEKQ
jgi:hypothetical protein